MSIQDDYIEKKFCYSKAKTLIQYIIVNKKALI